MSKNRISAVALMIVGALQIVIPMYILPVCNKPLELASGGTAPMKCHWYGNVVCAMGVVLLLQAIVKFVSKSSEAIKTCDIYLLFTGAITLALGTDLVIGVCSGAMMACHMGTRQAVNILGALTMIIGVLDLVSHREKTK